MLGNDRNASDTDTGDNSLSSNRRGEPGGPRGRLWPALFALFVCVSLVVLFTPASGVPSGPPGIDKVIHAALFAALAGTGLAAGLRGRWLVPVLASYAVLSEVIQASAALGRTASAVDALAVYAGSGRSGSDMGEADDERVSHRGQQ
jgi:hypothetical protein